MKEELTTILEAVRGAQAELADYLVSADRNAELTIAKLVGILERREVIKANGCSAPWSAQARRNQRWPRRADGLRHDALRKALLILRCGMKNPA